MTDRPDVRPAAACAAEEATPEPTLLDPAEAGATVPPTPAGAELPRIDGYEVLARLGQGGMGIVFRARHKSLDRLVALKMIRDGLLATPAHVARFQAEARAVARLQHPGIVQIFEIGEHADPVSRAIRPYFALELVEGGNLSQRLAGGPLEPAEAARLVEVLARTMQYAHEQGIIHRDLKPANILLTEDGAPKVTDFGLAKEEADLFSAHSVSNVLLGTPSYMAPEQAWGPSASVGPAADVYALGAILYECLTGKPPFLAGSLLEVLEQVRQRDPVPPSRRNPAVPRDLETICLKALHKDPKKRYASAEALAADLARFQAGEPIAGRRVGTAERAWKWLRRRPAQVAVTALLLLTVFSTALGAFFAIRWAWQQREAAQIDVQRAQYPALIQQAHQALTQQRLDLARRLLDRCPDDVRGLEWELLSGLVEGQTPARLGGLKQPVQAVAFDPVRGHLIAAVDDGVRFWDGQTLAEVPSFKTGGRVQGLTLSSDGRYLAALVESARPPAPARLLLPIPFHWFAPVPGLLQVYPVVQLGVGCQAMMTMPALPPVDAPPTPDAPPPQAAAPPSQLVLPTRRDEILVWDLERRTLVVRWICPSGLGGHAPVRLAFRPGGSQLAVLASARAALGWPAGAAFCPVGQPGPFACAELAPGKPLAEERPVGPLSVLAFFDLKRPRDEPRVVGLYGDDCHSLTYSPCGCILAVGGVGGQVRTLDPVTGRPRAEVRGPNGGTVVSLAYDRLGLVLAAGTAEGHIDLYHARTGELLHMLPGHAAAVREMQFHPAEPRLLTLGGDGYLKIWNTDTGQPLLTTRVVGARGGSPYHPALSLSDTGATVAVASSPEADDHGLTLFGVPAAGKPEAWQSRPVEVVGVAQRKATRSAEPALPPCPLPLGRMSPVEPPTSPAAPALAEREPVAEPTAPPVAIP